MSDKRKYSSEEWSAIKRYCKTAHPSNIPKNLEKGNWRFIRNRDGKLTASLVLGGL